ncbi:MAG: hypothetical protein LAT55_10110 [Opitutales bacterium]|nr:hypothetical protein [Opitutales bacterium]
METFPVAGLLSCPSSPSPSQDTAQDEDGEGHEISFSACPVPPMANGNYGDSYGRWLKISVVSVIGETPRVSQGVAAFCCQTTIQRWPDHGTQAKTSATEKPS